MSTPSVTEITRRTEAVAHDTFIDHLHAAGGLEPEAEAAQAAVREPRIARLT